MMDFWPISLCNVLYKIIAKALSNILKNMFPYLIDDLPSGFVPDHLITENVIMAFEAFHCIQKANKNRDQTMDINLDMRKEYDRMEWDFF